MSLFLTIYYISIVLIAEREEQEQQFLSLHPMQYPWDQQSDFNSRKK